MLLKLNMIHQYKEKENENANLLVQFVIYSVIFNKTHNFSAEKLSLVSLEKEMLTMNYEKSDL